ncbi:unnamed protein product [Durusdinium trenchii]|uniref:Uncharacterized protein n=1 Tax=Durusdinium trenchii TaxID=1381693 RepID=A0ABP0HHW5_9DINO
MIWSGLRFADLQRITLPDLILDSRNARGWCWRAKTSASGHAFGVVSSGFLSRGSRTWLWKFLTTLDTVLSAQDSKVIDFLLPACTLQGVIYPLEPMAYAGALAFLRELAHCDWRSQPSPLGDIALSFTVHSLKATLLSWGPQLHEVVSKEVRLAQGHHKDSNQSLDLYGRDSVCGSLQFQQIVINQVRAGFRPQIAQHRGAQAPLIEPPVDLPDCVEEDSSSDSSSSSDDSVQETNPAVSKRSQPPVVDEVLMAKYRTVVHALLDDLESTETDSATQLLRTACGRKLPKFATVVIDSIDSTLTLRQHSGCRKAWASLG